MRSGDVFTATDPAELEALRNGRKIEPGERQVSVLFADIRGYTPFAAGGE